MGRPKRRAWTLGLLALLAVAAITLVPRLASSGGRTIPDPGSTVTVESTSTVVTPPCTGTPPAVTCY